MKSFVIVRNGYEYNDEYYEEAEPATVEPIAHRDQAMALDECDRLNGKHAREHKDCTTEDGRTISPYKVVEIETPE